ncbi:MAG TPA: helix-turn-helix transcriptional regulator, partial [Chlamydiales bacterium]|nr:helix-turn-helix transcriptional regulator [Chlamydiales bacterium]
MKRSMVTEKLMLEEVALIAKEAQKVSRGLSMGEFIKMIRQQLGMTQSILAKRARIPQATLSNMERG